MTVAETKVDRRTILVVEDDQNVRRVLNIALSRAGFAVAEVETGAEALTLLQAGGVSGMLLDMSLRDQGTGDVLAWLHEHEERPPWLVLSAMDHADAALVDDAIDGRFVAKPFDPWDLIERIKQMIGPNEEE